MIRVQLLLGGVFVDFFSWMGKGDCPKEGWMLLVVQQIRRRSGSIFEVVLRMKYGI